MPPAALHVLPRPYTLPVTVAPFGLPSAPLGPYEDYGAMANQSKDSKAALGWVLSIVFAFAMIMGPGPGIYLVNPDPAAPGPAPTALGMPVLYVWAVGWFIVQLAVVLVAYYAIWSRHEPAPPESKGPHVAPAAEIAGASPTPKPGGNDA